MNWNDALDRLLDDRPPHVVVGLRVRAAEALAASLALSASVAEITRERNHPKWRGKETPRSPRPGFKKR